MPTWKIEVLEFSIGCNSRSTEINREKAARVFLKIREILQNLSPSIWTLASIFGLVISIFLAVPIGKLSYLALEKQKIFLLKKECGNYDIKILNLNRHAIEDIKYWFRAISNFRNNFKTPQVNFESNIDVSEAEWGATEGSNLTWEF